MQPGHPAFHLCLAGPQGHGKKFIPAHTEHLVLPRAELMAQHRGHLLQGLVPHVVAPAVVDRFEAVHVHHHTAHRPRRAALAAEILQIFHIGRPVGQARQHVGIGDVIDLVFPLQAAVLLVDLFGFQDGLNEYAVAGQHHQAEQQETGRIFHTLDHGRGVSQLEQQRRIDQQRGAHHGAPAGLHHFQQLDVALEIRPAHGHDDQVQRRGDDQGEHGAPPARQHAHPAAQEGHDQRDGIHTAEGEEEPAVPVGRQQPEQHQAGH